MIKKLLQWRNLGGIYTPRSWGTFTLLPMLFYLTSALSRPLISLSPTTPGTITSLPTPIPLMSALSKVLFGPCTRSSVEVPFTAHKLAQVMIFTLPPHLRWFLKIQGHSVLWAAPLWSEIEGLWRHWHLLIGGEGTFARLRRFSTVDPSWEWSTRKTSDLRDSKGDECIEGYGKGQ